MKLKKPEGFYSTFERKGPGEQTTHYCPGCGHGTVHKMIAEAIEDFGVKDRTIFCSPVGCSVFAYYYFDTGNIQCAHGRAPAVATGVRRVHEDAVIVSYQGDGDLAGIGTAEIIHAANRGENITVFFVNNAVYGMTGGQMAPTTLVGQQTLTTPEGRSRERDGNPIGMCELISALEAPVYVERVSLGDGNRVLKTRKAVRKALKNQIDRKGFSFVEILSPCPINWKLTPMEARTWLMENLEPVFPLKVFRDVDGVPHQRAGQPMGDAELLQVLGSQRDLETIAHVTDLPDQRVKIAGFGGQGVLSAGILLANCAISEDLHATWLPSYGPEMRGGTANASVIVSEERIGSPLVNAPTTLIALNGPSMDAFEATVVPGGLVVANSSLIEREPGRTDIRYCMIPASQIAHEHGFQGAANVALLAAYAAIEGFPEIDVLKEIIPHALKKKDLVEVNLRIVDAAVAFVAKAGMSATGVGQRGT